MSPWLLGGVAVVYLYVAVEFVLNGKPGMALAFGAYAISNVGLIWESMR